MQESRILNLGNLTSPCIHVCYPHFSLFVSVDLLLFFPGLCSGSAPLQTMSYHTLPSIPSSASSALPSPLPEAFPPALNTQSLHRAESSNIPPNNFSCVLRGNLSVAKTYFLVHRKVLCSEHHGKCFTWINWFSLRSEHISVIAHFYS